MRAHEINLIRRANVAQRGKKIYKQNKQFSSIYEKIKMQFHYHIKQKHGERILVSAINLYNRMHQIGF